MCFKDIDIILFIENHCTWEARRAILKHISECSKCLQKVVELKKIQSKVRKDPNYSKIESYLKDYYSKNLATEGQKFANRKK